MKAKDHTSAASKVEDGRRLGIKVEGLEPNGKKRLHVEVDSRRHVVLPGYHIPVVGVSASKVGGASVALRSRRAHDVRCMLYVVCW
jgi:hypothetical protein